MHTCGDVFISTITGVCLHSAGRMIHVGFFARSTIRKQITNNSEGKILNGPKGLIQMRLNEQNNDSTRAIMIYDLVWG